eukprot:4837506-Pyramimonas_sp.AAC.1
MEADSLRNRHRRKHLLKARGARFRGRRRAHSIDSYSVHGEPYSEFADVVGHISCLSRHGKPATDPAYIA